MIKPLRTPVIARQANPAFSATAFESMYSISKGSTKRAIAIPIRPISDLILSFILIEITTAQKKPIPARNGKYNYSAKWPNSVMM